MNDSIHLEANVVAVNRADLIPPSSVSGYEPSVKGAETKAASNVALPAFFIILLLVLIIVAMTLKYGRK